MIDTSEQLYEQDATGLTAGVYADLRSTFRAPFVNWIFRTLAANEPALLRHLWYQVKPMYETRAFAEYSVAYRDAVLAALDDEQVTRRFEELPISPAEFRELKGQVETFDVVCPRLALLFHVTDRCLSGETVGAEPADEEAVAAPAPDWLDRDRGLRPTMVAFSDYPAALDDTVARIQAFHGGFEDGLPSIYRVFGQWPDAFAALWEGYEPLLDSPAFDRGRERAEALVVAYADGLPYRPRLAPDDLSAAGFDDDTVNDLAELFDAFHNGAVETVVPALPVFAESVGVAGPREL